MGAQSMLKILSANLLLDGDVVYRTAAGGWSLILAEAVVARSDDEAEALLAAAAAEPHVVVDAALAPVAIGPDGAPSPLTLRERIRALGPTTRPDLGKQADQGAPLPAEAA